ncbi:O-antigen ligase family protein [Patescibacteria group bacterium]|nr:O-antigen ligase family protein [Patescibacteria group bacterium]
MKKYLFALAAFLLIFIPLYPKIPLFSPIEQYIVRVRIEDILILMAGIWWLFLVIKKKARWRSPLSYGIALYIAAGVLSTLSAVFITQTVPITPLHLTKTLLHLFRYVEYFSLFFIMYAVVTSLKQAKWLIGLLSLTVILASIYGYGQKFYYWPVYSTMNREFSKGIRLYLTEHARVQSTFAGHYDLAAFLVVALPLILAMGLGEKKKLRKGLHYSAFFLGTWLLVISASRTPFAAFVVAIWLVILWLGWLTPKWKDKLKFWITRYLAVYSMLFLVVYYFGSELLDRLSFAISNEKTGLSIDIKKEVDHWATLARLPNSDQLYQLLPKAISPASDSLPAPIDTDLVASISDQPPVTTKPQTGAVINPQPKDVYVNVPEIVSEEDITLADGTIQRRTIHKQRTYSNCALERELSLCIRLESLWPWALDGFHANPILGTGYATLNKQFIDEFTIAESTDNNFLRTLGETGLVGFITFYGTILMAICLMFKHRHTSSSFRQSFYVGLIAGIIGLLINAVYIDVFVASKVALTFWALVGMAAGLMKLEKKPV